MNKIAQLSMQDQLLSWYVKHTRTFLNKTLLQN